jgi:hypothetical protein
MDDHLWLCPKSTAFQVFSEGLVNYGPLPWSQGFHLPCPPPHLKLISQGCSMLFLDEMQIIVVA